MAKLVPETPRGLSRRAFTAGLGALGATAGLGPLAAAAAPIAKRVPATGEALPAIGLGTWITFNVGDSARLRAERLEVVRTFFAGGGAVIDSSPMYGSSEEVVGYCLEAIGTVPRLFSATKVWTPLQWHGRRQMEASRELWGVERFDLMQVHNLLGWEGHLETLAGWKAEGRVRHVGITTSHGRDHDTFETVMRSRPIDFVQFTYNILDRQAEQRLLPLAAERGLGVIINRPFRQGALIDAVERHPLPEWAGEIDCANWPQFLLKFIISHPAVTCAIPATTRADHAAENMGAATGRLPDADMRARMIRYVEGL
jgi:diketogulonate reductase-like aldo/keto reductase